MKSKKQQAGIEELPVESSEGTVGVEVLEASPVVEPVEHSPTRLAGLMRKVVARRSRVRETQQKLRDIELELRHAPVDTRSRFERMREAALDEYRAARAEAARTRTQLVMTLRLLPSRS